MDDAIQRKLTYFAVIFFFLTPKKSSTAVTIRYLQIELVLCKVDAFFYGWLMGWLMG